MQLYKGIETLTIFSQNNTETYTPVKALAQHARVTINPAHDGPRGAGIEKDVYWLSHSHYRYGYPFRRLNTRMIIEIMQF